VSRRFRERNCHEDDRFQAPALRVERGHEEIGLRDLLDSHCGGIRESVASPELAGIRVCRTLMDDQAMAADGTATVVQHGPPSGYEGGWVLRSALDGQDRDLLVDCRHVCLPNLRVGES
jgi:hypothetical protein